MFLSKGKLTQYVKCFNENDSEAVIQYVSNNSSEQWLWENIPLFECSDRQIEETYYFRWWVYRKHIKRTPEGFVITEFLPDVAHAGRYNSINAANGHHIYEGRWLKNSGTYLADYIRFWLDDEKSHSYSTWLCDALWNYCLVTGDFNLALDLIPKLICYFDKWKNKNLNESGLFWSDDDRDAMEFSISGPGFRPTLNSYMYGDSAAISKIAVLAGMKDLSETFAREANNIKDNVQNKLWCEKDQFFKVIPVNSKEEIISLSFDTIDSAHNVRELIGYVPWYFNLPDSGFEAAWSQLMDNEGFFAPYGPTTAEQRHKKFMYKMESVNFKNGPSWPHSHQCFWCGPSWPFSTSVTLTALANFLNNTSQNFISKGDYLKLLKIYARSHYREINGKTVSWIDENLDPYTGKWLARDILEKWGWPQSKGGMERGRDYNHSTYCDLIISGLVGIRPSEREQLEINPLIEDNDLDYFCLDKVQYRNRLLTVVYDNSGEKYNIGKGLKVFVDGVVKASSEKIEKLKVSLQGSRDAVP